MQQEPAALDVGEELVPESGSLGRALDQAGDVGEDELALAVVDRPEDRLERRERVVGDLRRGPRHPRQQRRLAGVRQPDQAGVGEQPQVQLDPARPGPSSPRSANRGACWVADVKRLLPWPPSPPAATIAR